MKEVAYIVLAEAVDVEGQNILSANSKDYIITEEPGPIFTICQRRFPDSERIAKFGLPNVRFWRPLKVQDAKPTKSKPTA